MSNTVSTSWDHDARLFGFQRGMNRRDGSVFVGSGRFNPLWETVKSLFKFRWPR